MANDNAHGGAWDCHPGIKPPDWTFQYQTISEPQAEVLSEYGRCLQRGPVWQSRIAPDGPTAMRIPVNKTTHRIRFEDETESSVTVVIEFKAE